ncbi:DegT/DnrJ/EryC1/StrS family aminotransferase [Amycolatopsis magusensis]|uniref:dTDP-4-amino-4,6-dideoxygalactose transaminase n=1 Tax=Amycolatopsis magusensis TaxID=882444 RepID=A0ABS4PVR1_9PSEU|nr:DegT/DnrJ/EryC1/StrS family aminotransferase [Amycolatopsis magusensis]MBP2182933.1 dTDP-4-amino-4,6-dideoxygalactose transaminase [Amycolatopsis magusensis]
MTKLAMFGGAPAVTRGTPQSSWPVVTDQDTEAVLGVMRSGRFTAASAGEQEIRSLEREWAERVGTAHCLAVANGTAALTIALAAAGVGRGYEVIVPALSFVGSALAPLHVGATPVFVDVHPSTFNLSPDHLAAAVSGRTAAVLPVHLHGLPADMDEILAFAGQRGLVVVEDVAQAPGVRYRGRITGSLGDLGALSLNVSKNLPTCGEGGLLTTGDPELADRAELLRQFGERLGGRGERPYVSHAPGWNAKINAIQAAFTRSQLTRFDEQRAVRDRNVTRLLARVAELPGFTAPEVPADREHGWHILRFRVRPEAFGLPESRASVLRAVTVRVMRAEGVPVSRYQTRPLSEQPIFADAGAPSRALDVSVTRAVVQDSFVLQRIHLNPGAGDLLERVAEAFSKVWEHRAVVANMADSHTPDRTPA